MKNIFKLINKSMEIITSDSGEDTKSGGYLPGGMMSLLIGRIVGMINKENCGENKMGRWNSIRIEGVRNKMQIIIIYRIPDSSQE